MSLPNWTKQFKISVGLLAFLSLLLFGLYKYVAMRLAKNDSQHSVAVLPNKDKEKISFNEKTHTLTIQTATKTTTEYARNPVVELRKDGSVSVSRHLAGFESEPFLGIGYADTGRIFVGDNVFHFSRFDLMGAVGWTPNNQYPAVKAFAGVSYAVYSNTSVGVCVNLDSIITKNVSIGGFVSVRL